MVERSRSCAVADLEGAAVKKGRPVDEQTKVRAVALRKRGKKQEDIAHAMGCRPWMEPDDPDFKIIIKVPNQGLIGCMTMEQPATAKI